MELATQWCDKPNCQMYRKVGGAHIRIFSHAARRLYCVVCGQTWSFDKGTAFAGLRSSHETVVKTLAHLVERNSLRATGRLMEHPVNTVLDWLEAAGAHSAAFSEHWLRNLSVTYAQVDELWTFVQKNKNIANRRIRLNVAICGSGGRLRCPAACGS